MSDFSHVSRELLPSYPYFVPHPGSGPPRDFDPSSLKIAWGMTSSFLSQFHPSVRTLLALTFHETISEDFILFQTEYYLLSMTWKRAIYELLGLNHQHLGGFASNPRMEELFWSEEASYPSFFDGRKDCAYVRDVGQRLMAHVHYSYRDSLSFPLPRNMTNAPVAVLLRVHLSKLYRRKALRSAVWGVLGSVSLAVAALLHWAAGLPHSDQHQFVLWHLHKIVLVTLKRFSERFPVAVKETPLQGYNPKQRSKHASKT
jgi:hypothetical protein